MNDYLEGWKNEEEVYIPPIKKRKPEWVIRREYIPPVRKQEQEDATVLLSEDTDCDEDATVILNREPKASLVIKRVSTGEKIAIDKTPFIIGKGSDNDFTVKDNLAVSRKHAKILTSQMGYFLEDMGSSNHSFINEVQIDEPVQLVNGMKFQLADEEFEVFVEIR